MSNLDIAVIICIKLAGRYWCNHKLITTYVLCISVEWCPDDFDFYTGNGYDTACFGLFTEEVSWDDAKTSCSDKGATLASIHNADERGFAIGNL